MTIGAGSTLTCSGNSKCEINCPAGGCTAECAGSSGCTLKCGGTTECKIQCNDERVETCAAGTTCSSTCAGDAGAGGRDGGDGGKP